MKLSVTRALASLVIIGLLLSGTMQKEAAAAVAGSTAAVISLRIEGLSENLYYNSALVTNLSGQFTLRDVINSLSQYPGVPEITVTNEKENSRITQIGAQKEKAIGYPYDDGWLISVNGKYAGRAPDVIAIKSGDDVVLYYADASRMQYPEVDLTYMITDGVVKITSNDETVDDKGNVDRISTPVSGAIVTWDGMKYTTNAAGEIIIDSTGAGVVHSLQIERCDPSGLPTVLRFAPGYGVTYGFDDVPKEEWYFESVMFVADKYLLRGVSEAAFAPDMPMNRAMFVTVIGRLTGETADQNATSRFPDVINDGWSAGYIAWADKNGIVAGYPDGTFGQYITINREQITVLLYRYAAYRGYNTTLANSDLSAYTDLDSVSGYAKDAVRWAVENGIMVGSGGYLNPGGTATRAQAASMLERFVSRFCTE